ncbi:MAG: BON domain-containing protein [Polyangiaceae bacterium]|nr:BON domain-containing protein [Polyangiaceae bacterium]
MRHYERRQYRHLDDGARYRDYDYLADDSWIGPNEQWPTWHRGGNGGHAPWQHTSPVRSDDRAPRATSREGNGHQEPAGFRHASSFRHERVEHRGGNHARSWSPRWSVSRLATVFAERPSIVVKNALTTLFRAGRTLRKAAHDCFALDRRDLRKRNMALSDQHIREEICERLARDPEIDDRGIEVFVMGGEAILDGFVFDLRTRYLAEDVLEDVSGVRSVRNRLQVHSSWS